MAAHDQDKWTESEEFMANADKFFPDKNKLDEVYGNQRETFDSASKKFFNSENEVNLSGRDQLSLTYQEARQYMYS